MNDQFACLIDKESAEKLIKKLEILGYKNVWSTSHWEQWKNEVVGIWINKNASFQEYLNEKICGFLVKRGMPELSVEEFKRVAGVSGKKKIG